VSRKLRAVPLTSAVPFMIVSGTAQSTPADHAAYVRKPCPVHLVAKQADTIIAFSRSLCERARLALAESDRLMVEAIRTRDDAGKIHSS
jgi:hypothetical protein